MGGNSLNKLLKFLYVKRISNNVIEIFDTYNNIYKRIYILSLKLIIKEDWLYNVLKLIEGWRGFKCLSIL
ncbi:hypothetical protein JTS93_02465 [Clostridium botulinum]|nr:hypothetical protein [Clostridium botulinum]